MTRLAERFGLELHREALKQNAPTALDSSITTCMDNNLTVLRGAFVFFR